jgi:hypothetical protein
LTPLWGDFSKPRPLGADSLLSAFTVECWKATTMTQGFGNKKNSLFNFWVTCREMVLQLGSCSDRLRIYWYAF